MGWPERRDMQLNPKGKGAGGREGGNSDSANTHPLIVPAPSRNCSVQPAPVAGGTLPVHTRGC